MQTVKRILVTGLMAATVATTMVGLPAQSANALPIDHALAQRCMDISRRTKEVVDQYNNATPFNTREPGDLDALVAEYRELLRQWHANGCDTYFGSLPRLQPRTSPLQVGAPQGQLTTSK